MLPLHGGLKDLVMVIHGLLSLQLTLQVGMVMSCSPMLSMNLR